MQRYTQNCPLLMRILPPEKANNAFMLAKSKIVRVHTGLIPQKHKP